LGNDGAVTIMPVMHTNPAVTRLTLLPKQPSGRAAIGSPVRRYRVARLQLVDDVVARNARFAHLKSTHD
jgi:hypothetical protein